MCFISRLSTVCAGRIANCSTGYGLIYTKSMVSLIHKGKYWFSGRWQKHFKDKWASFFFILFIEYMSTFSHITSYPHHSLFVSRLNFFFFFRLKVLEWAFFSYRRSRSSIMECVPLDRQCSPEQTLKSSFPIFNSSKDVMFFGVVCLFRCLVFS